VHLHPSSYFLTLSREGAGGPETPSKSYVEQRMSDGFRLGRTELFHSCPPTRTHMRVGSVASRQRHLHFASPLWPPGLGGGEGSAYPILGFVFGGVALRWWWRASSLHTRSLRLHPYPSGDVEKLVGVV
jgi:hypothetical protein